MPRPYKKGLRSTVYERNSLETCRAKIQTVKLLNRLQDNGMAEKEFLTQGQIASIKIALDKSLPNLASVEHQVEHVQPFAVMPAVIEGELAWEGTFTPKLETEH